MRTGAACALAIIVVLTIVVISAVARYHKEKFTVDASGQVLQSIYDTLKNGVSVLFREILRGMYFVSKGSPAEQQIPKGKIPILNAPFEGTLDEMELRTWDEKSKKYKYIVDGGGKINVSNVFTVNYRYRLDTIYGLASGLAFSADYPSVEISDISPDGSQNITLRIIGHMDALRGKTTTSASAGELINGKCPDHIWINDVNAYLTLRFTISGCNTDSPRVTDITATQLRFTFGSIDYKCSIQLGGIIGLYTYNLESDIRKPIFDAVNSQLRDVLIKLVRDHFSQIQFPLLTCVRIPACIPGVLVGDEPRGLYTPTAIGGLTFGQCKNLCQEIGRCAIAVHDYGEASGREGHCLMYDEKALGERLLPVPMGDVWMKKENKTIRDRVLFPTVVGGVAFPGVTHLFDPPECERRARLYGLSAWGYDEKGCHLYSSPYEYQKMSLNLLRCGKNLKKPAVFV